MENWITDSRDEQAFEDLFRDVDQIHVPIFQREYVWKLTEFQHLIRDITLIKETIEKSQFLGAIVAYDRPRSSNIVGRLRELDIVDGQQRILTLYIFILAIAERVHFYDTEISSTIVQEFLLLPNRRGLEINTRIVPSFNDRNQFRALWDRVNSPESMKKILKTNPPKPPLASGPATGMLINQYARIIKWLKETTPRTSTKAVKYLQSVLEIITRQMTFVNLKLTDASVATKIFERLNFRGIKVGIVDLVRNEVFVNGNMSESIRIYQEEWKPFESNFGGRQESFFFPYCLIHNSNIKKSELFSELRTIWKGFSPEEIIEHMTPFQIPFIAIANGEVNYSSQKINDSILRLHNIKTPSALYPFIMKLLYEVELSNISKDIAVRILEFLESFLVRRAIVGYEPTGLHALFKGVWSDIESNPTDKKLKEEILKRPTIQYPTNKELKEAIQTRALAKSRICSYLLSEYDKSLPGDKPLDKITIEHVLPQSYDENSEWAEVFSKDDHKKYKDTLANLVPLSQPLNASVQVAPYKIKQTRYQKESMFITPRKFAEKWKVWNVKNIEKRSEELYQWIITRWKE